MQLRITLVDAATRRATEALVDAAEGDTVSELVAHLQGDLLPGLGDIGSLCVDGAPLPSEALLGTPPLVHGALVTVHRRDESDSFESAALADTRHRAIAHLDHIGGPGAGRSAPLPSGGSVLGRGEDATVLLADPGASRAQAHLDVGPSGIRLRDLHSTNGTQHLETDDAQVPATDVPTDRPLALTMGSWIRVGCSTLAVRRHGDLPTSVRASGTGTILVNRAPRTGVGAHETRLALPAPPQDHRSARAHLLAAVVPALFAVALAIVLDSPMMLAFAVVGPLVAATSWWSDRRHGRQVRRADELRHAEALEELAMRMREALALEHSQLCRAHPDCALVLDAVRRRQRDLWVRRPGDDDFLCVRVGLGSAPSRLALETHEGNAAPDVEDLADMGLPPRELAHAPLVLDLRQVRVLGISGPAEDRLSLAAAVIGQLCAWHSPREVALHVLRSDMADAQSDWNWLGWTPHLAETVHESEASEWARATVDRLTARERNGPDSADQTHAVVILDGAQALLRLHDVDALLEAAAASRVIVIALDSSPTRLPRQCRAVVGLPADQRGAAHLQGLAATGREDNLPSQSFVPDLPEEEWRDSLGRALAPLRDNTPGVRAQAVPNRAHLLEARGLASHNRLTITSIREAWGAVTPGCATTLGVGADGPVRIDLASDGPHALVGGTTGSGKSELLQSLVAGLALEHSPEELAFVLVDYKGGAAFRECARLPHCVGLVTDLDEPLTRRALASLDAEVRRREAYLACAGMVDHAAYLRARAEGAQLPPLARLVIVVDEFKVLAEELPDFVDGLVRLAAVGRSLGIHLVLATQRPAGAITPDMRANISLRIALRVRDADDSQDVIESPRAAAISDRTPGRALVRGADGVLVEMQTARVLGVSDATDRRLRVVHVDSSREEVSSGPTDLDRIVAVCREAASAAGLAPVAPPWLPPLPTELDSTAAQGFPIPSAMSDEDAAPRVPLGVVDLPDEQAQRQELWDLGQHGHLAVAGAPRSGRTSLAALVVSELESSTRAEEVHVHVVSARPFAHGDSHVGVRVCVSEPDRIRRLVAALREEVQRRAGHGPVDGNPRDLAQRPWIVLVIDGWEAVLEALDGDGAGHDLDDMVALLREGLSVGLRAVVTGGRGLLVGRVPDVLDRRYVLRLGDPHDAVLAGVPAAAVPSSQPPGRALRGGHGAEVQFALPRMKTPNQGESQLVPPGRLRLDPLPQRVRLPQAVPDHGSARDALGPAPAGTILLGARGDHGQPIRLPAGAGELLILGPPRSGRTTALRSIALQRVAAPRRVVLLTRDTARLPADQHRTDLRLQVIGPHEVDLLRTLLEQPDAPDLLIDDLEAIHDRPAESVIQEARPHLAASGALLAAATSPAAWQGAFRGLAVDIGLGGVGLVLHPRGPADGELLRTAVPRGIPPSPGRAILVDRGRLTDLRAVLVTDEEWHDALASAGAFGAPSGPLAEAENQH